MRYLDDLPPLARERLEQVIADRTAMELSKPGHAGKAEAKRRWRDKRRTVDCVSCGRRVRLAGLNRCLQCRRGW